MHIVIGFQVPLNILCEIYVTNIIADTAILGLKCYVYTGLKSKKEISR